VVVLLTNRLVVDGPARERRVARKACAELILDILPRCLYEASKCYELIVVLKVDYRRRITIISIDKVGIGKLPEDRSDGG